MLSVPTAMRKPSVPMIRFQVAATRARTSRSFSTIAGCRCLAGLNPGRDDPEWRTCRRWEAHAERHLDHRCVEQHTVLDGIDAVFDRERGSTAAMSVGRKLQSVLVGDVGGTADLACRERRVVRAAGDARHAAGDENLDQPGAARSVPLDERFDVRLRCDGGERVSVSARFRELHTGADDIRPERPSRRHFVADQEIDLKLLRHRPQRGHSGKQVRQDVAPGGGELNVDRQHHLSDLVAPRRHDRQVRVRIDESRQQRRAWQPQHWRAVARGRRTRIPEMRPPPRQRRPRLPASETAVKIRSD